MLASREDICGLRVYRCEAAGLVCVLSGAGPDKEHLELSCEECVKKPRLKAEPSRQETHTSGANMIRNGIKRILWRGG